MDLINMYYKRINQAKVKLCLYFYGIECLPGVLYHPLWSVIVSIVECNSVNYGV